LPFSIFKIRHQHVVGDVFPEFKIIKIDFFDPGLGDALHRNGGRQGCHGRKS
jgi:hypothetical protein